MYKQAVYFFFLIIVLFPVISPAQKVYKISYDYINNGKKSDVQSDIYYYDSLVYLSKSDAKIQQYTDLRKKQNISTIVFEDKVYARLIPFSELPEPDFDSSRDMEVLGYKCSYASYTYFSNKIEVWFTSDTRAKGSPYSRFLPAEDVLVTRVLVNGNSEFVLASVKKAKDYEPYCNFNDSSIVVNDAEFEEIKINSRFSKLMVFDNEKINFNPDILPPTENELKADTTYRMSKGSVILKKIKLTPELSNSEYIFAQLTCRSNGDAYDRTGSVFTFTDENDSITTILDAYINGKDVLPVFTDNNGKNYQGIAKTEKYAPPVELMRFFTSFGAGHFNELREINNYPWAGDVVYKQDITSLIPSEDDEIWIGVFIGNYDGGGHVVSLELDFYPSGQEVEDKHRFIEPLFSTVNTMEMSGQNYGRFFNNDTLEVSFEIPDSLDNVQLLYTSTGHGGWGGGDEFNPKLNQIFIDGEEIFHIVPWRTDCATYRFSNPASGNFSNGMSSSDLSRSNWCPATLTPPYIIPLESIEKGKHTMKVVIDQGDKEGGSFSHWCVTGVMVGE